jgi:hypothetical protein
MYSVHGVVDCADPVHRGPVPLAVEVAGRGAEEEEGSTGVPVSGSPGLGWRRCDDG